ncbi:ELWxxDGT repeat protein [Corallococcus terminator]|uniref:Hyalin n=1 Tax=Corallococcus terminator TaxID=2316733 RepID=A0A3A8J1U3_9BACT|nr:ELWxxDGT repeat protein [Corallococcus terminator]RKG85970.1 hyalin [Corallococcus terminator]
MKRRSAWLSLTGLCTLLAACGPTETWEQEGPHDASAVEAGSTDERPLPEEAGRGRDCGCRSPTFVADLTPGSQGSDIRDFRDLTGTPLVNTYNGELNALWKLVERRGPDCARPAWDAILLKGGLGGPPLLFGSVVIGRTLFFAADDGVHGLELWKTDGTPGGTVLVKDIAPGPGSSGPLRFLAVGRTLYFVADDGVHGYELWKSDGTPGGTRLVEDIYPGPDSGFPNFLVQAGANTLLFNAEDGVHGREPWKSDGTRAGTRLVEDLVSGPLGSDPTPFQRLTGNRFLFVADVEGHGRELCRTDGTPGGTGMVRDINPGTGESSIPTLTLVDGLAYFSANDGRHGQELWKSDGTPAGTMLVEDIYPGPSSSAPMSLVRVGTDQVFFNAEDGVHGREPWRSEDSARHTLRLADVWPGPESGGERGTAANGKAYFFGQNPTYGHELWVTDGTRTRTRLLKDINPGPANAFSGDPNDPYAVGSGLIFDAFEPVHGDELWWTDGSTRGTRMADLYPGPQNSSPSGFTRLRSWVFFAANDEAHGREPWALPVKCFPETDDDRP